MKLWIVGIGPGGALDMTQRARQALAQSDVLAGYDRYIALVREDFPGKRILSTPMKREVDRCRLALEQAAAGNTVAMVCSGDAGIYGMAGLIYELAGQYPPIEIEVVAGVTAACAGAALLGAPLMHDFAVISLSDLLTPWEQIEKRLHAAAVADFCICLYNPASRGRAEHLKKACDILLRTRSPETAAGWARCIGREGEQSGAMTLGELRNFQADMFTTVFIGNTQTEIKDGRMITPRGYRDV